MAGVPSLSEITSVKGDADLAYGTSGVGGTNVKYDFSKAIPLLAEAAQQKQRANQFKVELFQKNLENFYKNFNDITVDGVMESDYPAITNEYAQLTKDLADNYDIIRNPMKDPQKFAMLQQREAALRGKISQSKQDLAYRKFNNDFINAHPDMNTEGNRQMLQQFTNSRLGERQYGTLKTPTAFNPEALAKAARDKATQTISQQLERRGGKWLDAQEEKHIKEQEYMNAWLAGFNSTDPLGRSGMEAARNAYNASGADIPFDTWLKELGKHMMGVDVIESKTSQTANPYGLQDDQQAFTAAENAKDRAQRATEFNRSYEANYGKNPRPEDLGRMKNEAWTMAFTTGNPNLQMMQNVYGNNDKVNIEVEEMIDNPDETGKILNPKIKTGKKTTVPVDRIQVVGTELNKDGDLVVKRVDNADNGKPMPDLVVKKREAYVDFNRIMGDKFATQTDEGSRLYMERKIVDPKTKRTIRNPDINTFRSHFQLDANGETQGERSEPKFRFGAK